MNGLVPFSRRGFLKDFQDVNDLFDRFLNASFLVPANPRYMRCDIKELENQYVLDIDLPGVKKDDIEVNLEDGYLTVSVKQEESKEQKGDYIMRERKVEGCQRSFRVGDRVNKDHIKAKFEDGVLTLTIDKKEEEPKDTKISVD